MNNKYKFFVDKFDNKSQTWKPLKTFFSRNDAEMYICSDVGKDNHIPFRIRKEKNE